MLNRMFNILDVDLGYGLVTVGGLWISLWMKRRYIFVSLYTSVSVYILTPENVGKATVAICEM